MSVLTELVNLSIWIADKKKAAEARMNIMDVASREALAWNYTVQAFEDVLKEVGVRICDLEQMEKQGPGHSQLRFVIKDIPLIKNARVLQVFERRDAGMGWYDVPLVEDAAG